MSNETFGYCENHCKKEILTKTEVNALLDGKSNTTHNHDERYYTEAEVTALLHGVTLYESTDGTTGAVTLSETAANFSFIEIYYRRSSTTEHKNRISSVRICDPNGKDIDMQIVHSTGAGVIQIYTNGIYIDGTSITRISNDYVHISNGDNPSLVSDLRGQVFSETDDCKLTIDKVIGYR